MLSGGVWGACTPPWAMGAQSDLGWTRTTLVKSQRMHAEGLCGDGKGREPVRKAGSSARGKEIQVGNKGRDSTDT